MARTLLRVAAGKATGADKKKLEEAAILLSQHHGSSPPVRMATRHKFWHCHGKDCKGEPCGYMVPTGKIACDACGHQPPAHISCPVGAAKGGGKGNGGGSRGGDKGGNGGGSGGGYKGTTLEKQLKAELEASKQELAKVKKLAAADACKAEAVVAPQAGEEGVTDEASKLALEVHTEIKDLKGDLHFFASLPEDRRNRLLEKDGGYEKFVTETRAKLDQCYKRQQGCKSLKQQLASAQGRERRVEKASANDDSQLAALQEQLAKLQADITAQQAKAAKSKTDLAAASEEVKRLAAATAAEGSRPGEPSAAPTASEATETAQMSMEQLNERSRTLQAQLEDFHAEANTRWNDIQALQASLDADVDIDSDAESVALSEAGTDDPKNKRKMDKIRTKKKVAEQFRKAASKFSKPVRG